MTKSFSQAGLCVHSLVDLFLLLTAVKILLLCTCVILRSYRGGTRPAGLTCLLDEDAVNTDSSTEAPRYLNNSGRFFFKKSEKFWAINVIVVLCCLLPVPHIYQGLNRQDDVHECLTFISHSFLGGQQCIKYECYESVLLGDEWTMFTQVKAKTKKCP